MNYARFIISVTALAASISSFADQGTYVGFSAGQGRLSLGCPAESGVSCSETDSGYKLYGGFNLSKQFAVEAIYFNFGKAKFTYFDPVFLSEPYDIADFKSSAFGIGGAFNFDFTPSLSATVRAGLANVKATVNSDYYFGGSASVTKSKPYFGLEAAYAVTPKVKLRFGIDVTKAPLFDLDTVEDVYRRVRLISAGLSYSF